MNAPALHSTLLKDYEILRSKPSITTPNLEKLSPKQRPDGDGAPGVFYVGVSVGLFCKKHADKMGASIFLYGYLLAKVTGWNSRLKVGAVLRGVPIGYERMMKETGFVERTIRRHIRSLENSGYIVTLRRSRGLSIYITNYKPAGKPRLGQGELPEVAEHKLSELADQGLVSGHAVSDSEGINEHFINTGSHAINHDSLTYLQPFADFHILLDRLFNLKLGAAEMRFLFRGDKHNKKFCTPADVLKAIARTLFSHELKKAREEQSGNRPRGITNILAYLNSGLHGPKRYLLQAKTNEQPYLDRIEELHNQIKEEIEEFKISHLSEKGV